MTSELLQNLIPTKISSDFNKVSPAQNCETTEDVAANFSGVLNTAKSKYVSSESTHTLKNEKAHQKEVGFLGKTISPDKNTMISAKESVNSANKDVVSNNNISSDNTEKVTDTPTEIGIDESQVKTTEQTETKETHTVTLSGDVNTKLSENILNNILLGNSMINQEDDDNSDTSVESNGTDEGSDNNNVVSNSEDVMLDTITKIQENSVNNTVISDLIQYSDEETAKDSADIISNEKNNITAEKVESESTVKTENTIKPGKFIDGTSLAIKSNDTLESLKQSEKDFSTEQNFDNVEQFVEEDMESIDNQSLVKVDEVIESSIDEFTTELSSEIKNNTKISQEVLDELDVTVRAVSANDMQKMNGGNSGQNFTNLGNGQQGNAQENIIKMSVEANSSEVNTIEFSDINTNINLPENSDILLSKTVDIGPKAALGGASQSQTISDTEILSQINNKLTLPQDKVTNKVNIILQPEQLGKVSVEIMQTKDGVVAKLVADTVQVKDLLDKSIESLKNTLASQGVNVNNITVKVEESSAAQNAGFGFEQEQFNREAANQSNQNQQRNSGNSGVLNEQESTQMNENSENPQDEPEILSPQDNKENISNENGSISIMV